MIRLIGAEWRKVFSTKLWMVMLFGSLALSALAVVGNTLDASSGEGSNPPLSSPITQRVIMGSSASALIFVLILGIVAMTTEFRHYTSRPTFLLQPHRGRIVVAKLIANAAIGLVFAILCAGLTLAIALPWLSAKGIDVSLTSNQIPAVLAGSAATVAIYAVVGVGVGVLARNQIAAIVGSLAYLFVVEQLLRIIPGVKEAYRFLPGGAQTALTQSSIDNSDNLFSPAVGGLLLLGWGLLFAIVGTIVTIRRDIP